VGTTYSHLEAALSQIMEFNQGDAGTIDRRSKTGRLKAVRDAATIPVMAGVYNTSPADLDIWRHRRVTCSARVRSTSWYR
jgi:hypothetical protein